MKKFIKALAVCVVAILTFSLTACTTYTKNGSVIQDVKFDVSYILCILFKGATERYK